MIDNVRIGPFTYRVEVSEKLDSGQDCVGETLFRELVIRVRSMAPDRMRQTLWHEIFHALFNACGEKSHDEVLIDNLAGAMVGMIRDNPGLFAKHVHIKEETT